MNLQPTLENEFFRLEPLQPSDFEMLFKAASDPLIWQQHPDKNRWKRDVFEQNFFKGAIESKGAFKIIDVTSGNIIGSTRYYDYDANKNEITVGFTFIERTYWGTKTNFLCKQLVLNHIFTYVDSVIFVVGTENMRSQKAMLKLGAVLSETIDDKCIFRITKSQWLDTKV